MRVVLGANGFIGSAVCQRLSRDGITFCGLNRAHADLERSCFRLLDGADTVYLCAGETGGVGKMRDDPLSFVLPNVRIHMNVFEAAQKAAVKRVVCVQSTTGYANQIWPMLEDKYLEGELHPAYFAPGNAHRFIYRLSQMVKGPEFVFFRPSNVYGPGNDFSPDKSHVIEATVRKVAERQNPFMIWGDGSEVRDAVYIDDLADAMVMDLPPGAYNVASGQEMTVDEIAGTLMRYAKFEPVVVHDTSKPTAISARRLDISKLKSFGWTPKVSMQDGLKRTLDWFEDSRRDTASRR